MTDPRPGVSIWLLFSKPNLRKKSGQKLANESRLDKSKNIWDTWPFYVDSPVWHFALFFGFVGLATLPAYQKNPSFSAGHFSKHDYIQDMFGSFSRIKQKQKLLPF